MPYTLARSGRVEYVVDTVAPFNKTILNEKKLVKNVNFYVEEECQSQETRF